MEDSGKSSNSKLLNPWMLQFQKMGLELKCPLCLNLFNRPVLLPCNHLFCSSCIADCTRPGSECAVCNTQYSQRDLRSLPFVENMVAIYRSLDATFCANLFQQRSPGQDEARVLEPCQTSLKSSFYKKLTEEPFKTSPGDSLRCGQSIFLPMTNKNVKVPLNLYHSDEVGIGKNHKYEKSSNGVHVNAEELEMPLKRGIDYSSAGEPNPMQCYQTEVRGREECGVMEMDMNQVAQSLLDSPPFCDTKGSDNDCSDQDSEHPLLAERLESSSLKSASKVNGNLEERMKLPRSESSASETEGLMREFKRQKYLTHGDDHIQPSVRHFNNPVASSCEQHLQSGKDSGALLPTMPDDLCSNTAICSFCQSSKTSEVTGPMLHYANGNLVTGDAAIQPNVIHVHRICIDWAPQVYFVDETVKNLKAELARGAKLKCSTCGLKGAALGCYVKSCRRTYHVTCAMEISTCRWDHEDFLMLCPVHSHVKFPNEKSKSKKQASQKHAESSNLVSQQSNPPAASQDDGRKLVFCGSALSSEDKILMINFASRIGATVTKFWIPNVTHVIAATDANGACSRTLKVLMAILNGRWILKMDWIRACIEVMHPVEEEPYEITLDNHGCHGGPKAGRLRILANEPKLFSGLNFYFSGDYMAFYKDDLEELVGVGGGTILASKEELEAKGLECQVASSKLLVVYNLDPPQGCRLGEEVSILWQRLNEAEDLASNTGSQVIGHTWILESIAACKLQPFVS